LRPKRDPESLSYAPEIFNDGALTDLEKKYFNWDKSLKEVTVDEVIMGNVVRQVRDRIPPDRRRFTPVYLKR